MNEKPIPKAVLEVLGVAHWMTDSYNLGRYAKTLEGHLAGDNQAGVTCVYVYSERYDDHSPDGMFVLDDIRKLAKVIPPEMMVLRGDSVSLNQHYAHSLGQFMANCQHQWGLHLERMAAIEGDSLGRIYRDAA